MLNFFKGQISKLLVLYLTGQVKKYEPFAVSPPELLRATLLPGDVLLVEGNQRFSVAVKYLTQSTWSHAAIFVGDIAEIQDKNVDSPVLIEADLENGVYAVPLSRYEGFNTRICRPVGLLAEDVQKVVKFMVDSIGMGYDLKNIVDLARYLILTPPVPIRLRRRMLSLGSGDPTRVICSTRIAQAFQSVKYPILPIVQKLPKQLKEKSKYTQGEILHIRHHSLFAPRDFDISPYFEVVKPTIKQEFNYKKLIWNND